MEKNKIIHRGNDRRAIAVGNALGLSFDGMQDKYYQFTIQQDPGRGITFYTMTLCHVERRLKEKLREFGIKERVR